MATYTPATPGVLSEDDYIWSFKIAGIIWDASTKASIHDGFGVQLSLTDLNTLQLDLRGRLAAFDSQTVIHIQDCITQWVPGQYNTAKMTAGSVGSTSGLEYDPERKRELIKEVFAGLTGCMGIWQAIMAKRRAMEGANQDNGIIGVNRG